MNYNGTKTPKFKRGDKVKITKGSFTNLEGQVVDSNFISYHNRIICSIIVECREDDKISKFPVFSIFEDNLIKINKITEESKYLELFE